MAKTRKRKKKAQASAEAQAPRRGWAGFVVGWVLPVVVGVGLGAGILAAWNALKSPSQKIADRWEWGNVTVQDGLAAELAGLGAKNRLELREVFLGLQPPDDLPEKLVWIAVLLGREPYFDTRFLLEQADGGSTWHRRTAALALVELLTKKVDPDKVLPGLLDWLEDLEEEYHLPPIEGAAGLLDWDLLTQEQRAKLVGALRVLADPERQTSFDLDDNWIADSRASAISALTSALDEPGMKEFFWSVALDDEDDVGVRMATIRSLSVEEQFGDVEAWIRLARSKEDDVRLSATDNLSRAQDLAFNEVLAELHRDVNALVRRGSVDTQNSRNQEITMLPIFAQLLEDHDVWVRWATLRAAADLASHEGAAARLGMLIRLQAESDVAEDVEGATIALKRIADQNFGFAATDVDLLDESVTERALKAFMADDELRENTAKKWEATLGGAAVWTDQDRIEALKKLLDHADPENQERARREIDALEGK